MLWKDATMQPVDCRYWKTNPPWRSIDAHLNHISTVIVCSIIGFKIHTIITDIQYIISMCNHMHPKASWPLDFWSTTILVLWDMDEVAPSHSSALCQQLTACRFVDYFFINIAQLPLLAWSSSITSICMTYHKQLSTAGPCAPCLSGEVCSGAQGWMQHDRGQSYWFAFHTDCSIHDWYDITDLNFVRKGCLKFRFCILTWHWQASRYQAHWLRMNWIWHQQLSQGMYDPCTCTDDLSYLSFWSQKSRQSWHVAE